MSRQNKNIQNRARAQSFKNGGPKSTTPKHSKNPANRVYTVRCRSLVEFNSSNKKSSKTSRPAV